MKALSIIAMSLIVSGSVLSVIDFPVELRFENTQYNYLFVMIICVVLPLSVFLTSLTFKSQANIYMGIVVSIVLALPSGLVYFFASIDYDNIVNSGVDRSFEKIEEINTANSNYRLYRTNGGATTSFGLVLRKETKLFQGVNVVKVIFSKYKAYESTLLMPDENTIELNVEPYSDGEGVEVLRLKI